MSKTIHTLIDDIYGLFGSEVEFDKGVADMFGKLMSDTVASRVPAGNHPAILRMSNLGQPCERKLWYSINKPEKGEVFTPETRFKFLYGDILEELLLYLAAEAGHKVEGMQDEMEIEGILGHRDAVIDGMLVDVKSASTYSFKRFQEGLKPEGDKFGYITQLQQYLFASQNDPLVTVKDEAAFLVVDKTMGKMCLDIHKKNGVDYAQNANRIKEVVAHEEAPDRAFKPEPEGSSGNLKLGVNCSYCAFKEECFPGLRAFWYSSGPRYLTRVVREPKVPEVRV